jgi:putative cell wall-binding protein
LLLATGSTFPDAVAGSAAAGHLGVPLLLSTSGSLSTQAAAEIDRLKPARVALLGGTAALGSAVAQQVAAHGPTVVRWQGADRFATAASISQNTYPNGATNVYLATGATFPDALAGAALAAVAGGPLLLTNATTLPSATAAEITRLHPSAIVVLGGSAAVSDGVANAAVQAAGGATLSRLQGADRYATADAVASVLVQVGGGASASHGVLLATGLDFPDALAGAAWAGASDRPLLLVPKNFVTPQTWQTIQDLGAGSAVVLGGTSAISTGVSDGLAAGNPPTAVQPTGRRITTTRRAQASRGRRPRSRHSPRRGQRSLTARYTRNRWCWAQPWSPRPRAARSTACR